MRIFTQALVATGVVALATTRVAAAKGEPPIQPPDPPPYTVIAHAIATAPVGRPLRRTDASIDHAFRAARANAIPKAVARARVEAQSLAAAGGLTLGRPVGIARDAPPAGYYDPDGGRFGPGKWCGRLYRGRRTVRRPDGTIRRVPRFRYGCQVPKNATVRVTVTFAAVPADA